MIGTTFKSVHFLIIVATAILSAAAQEGLSAAAQEDEA